MKIRYRVKGLNYLLLFICAFTFLALDAQVECKSNLGAHFKPVGNSTFSWAAEAVLAQGAITDRNFTNTMINGGFNYASKDFKHQFYMESALKYWQNSNPGAVNGVGGDGEHFTSFTSPDYKHFSLRELFYQFNNSKQNLKVGVQTYMSPDYFLVHERMLGLSYQINFGALGINSAIGTTHTNISKMQNICGTRHIYRLLREGKIDFVGDKLFESNMLMFSLNYQPDKKGNEKLNDSEGDEFSEFESMDSFESSEKTHVLNEIGTSFYQEFGSVFHNYKYYGAVFSSLNLPMNVTLKLEGVYQYIANENVAVAYSSLMRNFDFNKSSLKVEGGYFHKFDSDVPFYPAFSNMFIGEVIRLDSKEMPIVHGSLKYAMQNKAKTYLRFGVSSQINGNRANEVDLEIGSKLWRGLRSFVTFSRIEADVLSKDYYMGKVELRYTL